MNSYSILQALGQAPSAGQGGPSGGGGSMFLLMMVTIMILFWLIMWKPQKREQQRAEAMRNAVKKGDKVVTIGGIHGTVLSVDTTKNTVSVLVDKDVKINFSRAAISTVITKEEAAEQSKQEAS